ncbi:MAG TPA: hypothetical protein VG122_15145, partial [Gemmata sp.]|nr:hypothetical protein [Gemmata sp.]
RLGEGGGRGRLRVMWKLRLAVMIAAIPVRPPGRSELEKWGCASADAELPIRLPEPPQMPRHTAGIELCAPVQPHRSLLYPGMPDTAPPTPYPYSAIPKWEK